MIEANSTTKLQQQASNPENSVWVFASAGSGKTKILTDRVLRLLLLGVSPEKILCLTFTKAAASEMQERINHNLADWISCDEEKLQKKLFELSGKTPTNHEIKKAQSLFIKILDSEAKLKIQTIHSFCQTLMKIFPFEAKITPNFEVIEQAQEKLLLKQAQKEILEQAVSNPILQNLVTKINAKLHEESFSELVFELLKHKDKLKELKEYFFSIEGVIDEIYKNFSINKNDNEETIFKNFTRKIDQEKSWQFIAQLDKSKSSKNKELANGIRFFLQNQNLKNFSNYYYAFFTKEESPRKLFDKIAEDKDWCDFMSSNQALLTNFKDHLNSLKICKNTALLLQFVDQILEKYFQVKKQHSYLDYNDLIHESNKLLANPDFADWVKQKIDSTFDHVLIDESQDTNHLQWNIIKALTEDFFSGLSASNKERSIFIVGDEKQSIYSFQGAEPNISEEIFNYFYQKLDGKLQKIELNNSFRSLSSVLLAVDKVFENDERKNAISKISSFKKHQPIRQGKGIVEVWPKIKLTKEETKNQEWNFDFYHLKTASNQATEQELMAEIIAQKIKSWVRNKVLENRSEPVKYSDFMILLRNKTNGFNQALIKAFHKYHIPFSAPSKIKLTENLLTKDLLAAIKFTLLPEDDLNLATLLKSPILAISEEDLFEICLFKNQNETSVFSALAQIKKFEKIKKYLDQLITKSQELNIFEFFYFLIEKNNNRKKIIAYFGNEAVQILDEMLSLAFNFCQNFSSNPQKFLEFVEKLDFEILASASNNQSVLISTVHGSKGLQAPIVMLPDCSYNFNKMQSGKEKIHWIEFDKVKLPIWCIKKSEENLQIKNHKNFRIKELKEEYLRLLYVAMTRAADELYISAFGNDSDPDCWYEIIKNSLPEFLVETIEENKIEEIKKPKSENEDSQHQLASDSEDIYQNQLPILKNQTQINSSQIRGKLIHKILEIFGNNYEKPKDWLLKLAQNLVDKEEFLSAEEKHLTVSEVSNFLHSKLFQEIFCGKVKCETEIIGEIENKKLTIRIDLLVIKENEIIIIDYKSDETLPYNIPEQYKNQLELYQKIIKSTFPSKKISTAILWIKFLQLNFISN